MKKIWKILFFIITVFILGGIGSVIFQSWLLPKASSSPFFSKYKMFKKVSENVTIINKTEQITVTEESSINKIVPQASSAVVGIISTQEKIKSLTASPFDGIKNGTGTIVTSDGLIVTYRTAIFETEAKYEIMLQDGSFSEAKLLGIDEFTNLAFLKVETSNLSVISFSNSNDLASGRKLIAIGSSHEKYQDKYATGILSNINKTFNIGGKTLSSSEKLEGVFETDFLSQKEYIGGPVIDYNGELVGIIGSVMIDNQEKFFQIPSNVVRNSMSLAVKKEFSQRPYLGIYYIPITKTYAKFKDIPKENGAFVFSSSGKQGLAVISTSPAEKAGIKINDIITSINEKEINLDNPLSGLLSQFKKGDQIELTVIRDKQEMKIKVQL